MTRKEEKATDALHPLSGWSVWPGIPSCSSDGDRAKEKGHSSTVLLPSPQLDKRRPSPAASPAGNKTGFRNMYKEARAVPPGCSPREVQFHRHLLEPRLKGLNVKAA